MIKQDPIIGAVLQTLKDHILEQIEYVILYKVQTSWLSTLEFKTFLRYAEAKAYNKYKQQYKLINRRILTEKDEIQFYNELKTDYDIDDNASFTIINVYKPNNNSDALLKKL